MPFATPELGRAIPKNKKYLVQKNWPETSSVPDAPTEQPAEDQKSGFTPLHLRANLLTELMLQRGYYSTSNQTNLINVGRLLELIVMSLVADVNANDIQGLLVRAPFHSMTDVAPTKPVVDGEEEPSQKQIVDENNEDENAEAIRALAKEMHDWRTLHAAALRVIPEDPATTADVAVTARAPCRVSPWLIYCVLNKVLNQAEFFNRANKRGASPTQATNEDVWQVARTTFNAFWAALGSFEKGPLFGLPAIVALTNISSDGNFGNNQLYLQNVAPFASDEAVLFGKQTRSLTAAMRDHPLRILLNDLPRSQLVVDVPTAGNKKSVTASQWLLRELGRTEAKMSTSKFPLWLKDRFKTLEEWTSFNNRFEKTYPKETRILKESIAAMQLAFPVAQSSS